MVVDVSKTRCKRCSEPYYAMSAFDGTTPDLDGLRAGKGRVKRGQQRFDLPMCPYCRKSPRPTVRVLVSIGALATTALSRWAAEALFGPQDWLGSRYAQGFVIVPVLVFVVLAMWPVVWAVTPPLPGIGLDTFAELEAEAAERKMDPVMLWLERVGCEFPDGAIAIFTSRSKPPRVIPAGLLRVPPGSSG